MPKTCIIPLIVSTVICLHHPNKAIGQTVNPPKSTFTTSANIINTTNAIEPTNKKYERELRPLFKFITNALFKSDTITIGKILSNKTTFRGCIRCLNKPLFKDSIFSEEEIVASYQQMMDTSITHTIAFPLKVKMVDDSNAFLETIFHFSNPIFLHNYQYCVVGYSIPYTTIYSKSGFDQGYKVLLCKKEGRHWKNYKVIGQRLPID